VKCHFCGKEVWFGRHLLDGDFCGAEHRRKYHERLRRSFAQLPSLEARPAQVAGFYLHIPPVNAPLPAFSGVSLFARAEHLLLRPPALGLAPLFGETFIATAEAAPATGAPGKQDPLNLQPLLTVTLRTGTLDARSWRTARPAAPRAPAAIRVLEAQAAVAVEPVPARPVPVPLEMTPAALAGPKLNIATALADGSLSDLAVSLSVPRAEPANGTCRPSRHLRVAPEPAAGSTGFVVSTPDTLAPVTRVAEATPDSACGIAHCRPPVLQHALLYQSEFERAEAAAARTKPLVEPVVSPARAVLTPALPDGLTPRLVAETGAMAKLSPALPWGGSVPAPVQLMRSGTRPVALPQLAIAPVSAAPSTSTVAMALATGAAEAAVSLFRESAAALPAAPRDPALPELGIAPVSAAPSTEAAPMALETGAAEAAASLPHETAAALSATPRDPALPELGIPPVSAAPSTEAAPMALETGAVEAAASLFHQTAAALPAVPRDPVLPALQVPGAQAALSATGTAQPASPDCVAPQVSAAKPSRDDRVLRAQRPPVSAVDLRETITPSVETCARPPIHARLRASHVLRPDTAPLAPPPAVPAPAEGPVAIRIALAVTAALPDHAASMHLPRGVTGAITPAAARHEIRAQAPLPESVSRQSLTLCEAGLHADTAAAPSLAGAVPLDVYVQRARTRINRECEWNTPSHAPQIPATSVGVWPARFEQLVLQDWKRRYPPRIGEKTAADKKAKVIAMPRRAAVVAAFRRSGRHVAQAAAACLLLGAVLWLSGSSQGVWKGVARSGDWFKTAIASRATVELGDNFRSGLGLWDGTKDWAKSWSYDRSGGFIRTGQLAFYRPSNAMKDYRMEFFAQIEKKSVAWAFRARDPQNYYAMKFTVTQPGPRPLLSVQHYPVLNGLKGKKVQVPVTVMVHNNMPYRVAVDVRGSRFTAYIEDQEVDSWSDDRLRSGGVGFFSDVGEQARLYWVKVSNNTDWLGRVCGMLAGKSAGSSEALNLWSPEGAGRRTFAALFLGDILDSAKNANLTSDRKRWNG
jgi:hypothetical protein